MCDMCWLHREPYYPVFDPHDSYWRHNWRRQFDHDLAGQEDLVQSFIEKDSNSSDPEEDGETIIMDNSSSSCSTCSTCHKGDNRKLMTMTTTTRSSRPPLEPETSEETDDPESMEEEEEEEDDDESVGGSSCGGNTVTTVSRPRRHMTTYTPPPSNDLAWVNKLLKANFTNIAQLGSGAAYCQLMDRLFSGSVPMNRVKFDTRFDEERVSNFNFVQAALHSVPVDKVIPIEQLVKGNYLANLKFLEWFRKFFQMYDTKRAYDAPEARKYAHLGSPEPSNVYDEDYSSDYYGEDDDSTEIIPGQGQGQQYPPQQGIVLGGTHRQCCQRGWYYKTQPVGD